MADIRQYLLSIITAAIICAIVVNITDKNGVVASVIRLLCGLFVIYTILSPWKKMHTPDLSTFISDLKVDASETVSDGKDVAAQAGAAIIKQEIEAYILDKASTLDMDITVNVIMDYGGIQIPTGVKLSGTASPYAKQRIMQIISDELGISKENQLWI
jgi:hypothetical protein